ncbi:hypothetical protein FO519_005466 [Halicephalobus sp. NKZ332]|nr:hypothetical protein FO519_005466 [Halicephalobus sp. NKZ332]
MYLFSFLQKRYTSKRSKSEGRKKDKKIPPPLKEGEKVTVGALVEAIRLQRSMAKQVYKGGNPEISREKQTSTKSST